MILKPAAKLSIIRYKVYFSLHIFFFVILLVYISLCAFFRLDNPRCTQYVSGRVPRPSLSKMPDEWYLRTAPNVLRLSILLEAWPTSWSYQLVGQRDKEKVVKWDYSMVIWVIPLINYLWCVFWAHVLVSILTILVALCDSAGKCFSTSGHVCGLASHPSLKYYNSLKM